MRINNIFYTLALLFLCNLCCASNTAPKIVDGLVIFDNGINIKYDDKAVLFDNSSEALEKKLPVSISEEIKLIEKWKILVLIKSEYFFEGSSKSLSLYDYEGGLILPVLEFLGDCHFLVEKKKLLLAGISSHYESNSSYIFSIKKNSFVKINHGEVFKVIVSDDEELIWFYSAVVDSGLPVTKLSVFNSKGIHIKYFVMKDGGVINFEYDGNKYSVKVEKPDFPG